MSGEWWRLTHQLVPNDSWTELLAERDRLRDGLRLIADDTHRLMNETARQTAASILGGKPIGATVQSSVALVDITAERRRQIQAEGWTPEHDDEHANGELALAACCYAAHAGRGVLDTPPLAWPWDWEWWKPKDRRRDLVRAAALLVAEIERLDRAASQQTAAQGTTPVTADDAREGT